MELSLPTTLIFAVCYFILGEAIAWFVWGSWHSAGRGTWLMELLLGMAWRPPSETRALMCARKAGSFFEKVFDFEQTHLIVVTQTCLPSGKTSGGTMAIPKTDKHREYTRYALHCMNMVAAVADQQSRNIQREMAAEWLKLAESVRRRPRSTQMQME